MPVYIYQALSRKGVKETGQIDAPTSAAARDQIGARGLYVTKLELLDTSSAATSGTSLLSSLFFRVSLKDKIFFTRQLAVLLRSGIPLSDALTLLVDQTDGRLKTISIALRDALREGSSLADALQRYSHVFPRLYIQLVRAAEASGQLEKVLEGLATYLEKQEEVRVAVRGAIRGPLMQLGVILGVAGFLMTVVVPQITQVFAAQKARLPWFSEVVIGIAGFVQRYLIVLLLTPIALLVLYRAVKATTRGAYIIDSIKLKLPIISYFTRVGAMVQFCRTLGMLLEGGVNLSDALDIVCSIVDNKVLVSALQEARENIVKQGRVTEYLRKTGIFSPAALYLINTGEQSGQLDKMLLLVAEYNEKDLTEYAQTLTARLNPFMTVIMGAVLLAIIFAVLVPLFELSNAAAR